MRDIRVHTFGLAVAGRGICIVVVSGSGDFVKNGERIRFAANDVLFVEAGSTHRFENFSEDFSTWVIFWGPEGGEQGVV